MNSYAEILTKGRVNGKMVVNVYIFWGTASDDWGLDSIPPIPLNVPRISNITRTTSINHLGDNVWHTSIIGWH